MLILIPSKYVACIDFIKDIVKAGVIAVGDNCLALFLELVEVVDNLASKEGVTVLEGWLIDDDCCALCFDTLHYSLD